MWRSLRKVSGYRPGNFIWFHNLSSFIPFSIANCDLLAFLIFRGSTYNLKTVNPYCVGFRVGSFIRTRKLAAYKSKIMKKKRDKALKLAAEQRARAKRRVYIRFKQAHQVVHRKNY